MICSGEKTSASVASYTAQHGEVIICASKVHDDSGSEGLPVGAIVGRVLVVDCIERVTLPHPWTLYFEQPETFPTPIPPAKAA
jgi:hypothetical protein